MMTVLLLAVFSYADTEPAPAKLTEAQKKVATKAATGRLEKLGGNAMLLKQLEDGDAVAKALPGHAFYSVLFRQFPVGRMPPKGLKVSNIFAVDAKANVTVITTAKELEKFLSASTPAASSEMARKEAARAAVRLGQELKQDGFFKFKLEDDSTKATSTSASAKAAVAMGGSGSYAVTLTFDKSGKVTKLEEDASIRQGPRPICHATKLLDPDPVVRGMAEQGIMCMGKACIPYLLEQREKAAPPLKKAIEGMWLRVVSQGW
jgi:hypothetical protein